MMALLTFNGSTLYKFGESQYKSNIDGKWVTFDDASKWYKLIKKLQ